ncbi:hypothetical protein CfE428DRAFT_1566 [Chthoniobacter flavus Ellin428]|uniref:Uncharacterized protein n=1 Tax=Chthoniobacter flavus Ellin428 TaxID=497964 RepID=B4CWV3_9BACT|nr:hypothetical protein [Chthoniobacter flavus]EDY21273.1 hypothetical protein CfE428DRAFT_1566 [Chthoniobacter flavus Ellin428]TCO87640.1 hypothetical protein EV701_121143 [Chthoniobacter flavus]
MDVAPPPLPPARISGFLLVSLVFAILAVAVTAALCTTEDWVPVPWQRLVLAFIGIGGAGMALVFGAIVLFDRRKGWPVAIFVAVISIAVFCFLIPQLPRTLNGMIGPVGFKMPDGMVQANEPIIHGKNVPTAAQARPLLVAWGEEAMVRPYEEHGHHNAKWDELARQFIRGMALEFCGTYPRPGLEELRPLAAELKRRGCDDPWVLFLVRGLSDNDPDFPDAMRAAAKTLIDANYAPFPLWLAHAETARPEFEEGPPPKDKADPAGLEALRAALTAQPLKQGALEAWLSIFTQEPGRSVLQREGDEVCQALESIPGMPEWFSLTVRGRMEIDRAWAARGNAWANSVSGEQWRLFSEHLQLAREALERAHKLAPNEPEPTRALITVELGSTNLISMRRRFNAAVANRFDDLNAYESFRAGLLPRWFGSEEAMLGFGRTCLATERFDTAVPWQMLRAVRAVAEERDHPDRYYTSDDVPWRDLNIMFNGYLAHDGPESKSYVLSTKLVLVAKAGHDNDVARLLKELNYKVDPRAVDDWHLPRHWVGGMAALSGPAKDLVSAAQDLHEGAPEQALQKLLAAQKIGGQPPAALEYIRNSIAELQAIIALRKAPWQSLTPPPDLAGWKKESGQWTANPATGITQFQPDKSGALLTRLEPIGDQWELRGELTMFSPGPAEIAIFCGPPDDQKQHSFSLRFWTQANRTLGISLARGFGEDPVSKRDELKRPVSFLIRLENGRLLVKSDDYEWFLVQPLPEGVTLDKNSVLSIGSARGGFADLMIRKLEFRAAHSAAQ